MSCTNSSSPIDLDVSKSSGVCDMKCDYRFNYKTSSCVATNNINYIGLNYDEQTIAPVMYNSIKYSVKKIKLYSPSLHTFSGNHTAAEIIIEHQSSQGTNPLYVCVPVLQNNASTESSKILDAIIVSVANNAPGSGDTTSIPLEHFSLNLFVPYKPFFSYTGTNFTLPCDQNIDYIVFDSNNNDTITISDKILIKLKELISAPIFPIISNVPFFYNKLGPGSTSEGDDIYIDCKPINKSDEEETLVQNKNESSNESFDFDSIVTSPIFQLLIGSLIFLVILFLVKYGIESIHKNNPF